MRNRNGYIGSDGKCRNYQLVCSLNWRNITGNRYKLYNSEYQYDDNLLGRCNEWHLYNCKQNVSDSYY